MIYISILHQILYKTQSKSRRHLSICCFGIPENYDLLFAQPTCVDQSATAMGTRLADLIIERIESKNEIANREVRFTTSIVIGNGTKAL